MPGRCQHRMAMTTRIAKEQLESGRPASAFWDEKSVTMQFRCAVVLLNTTLSFRAWSRGRSAVVQQVPGML